MAKKQRRRTGHAGVKVLRRLGIWVGRWIDPASGKQTQITFHSIGVTSAEARAAWARRKADQLARERGRRLAGGRPVERIGAADAIDAYLAAVQAKRSAATARNYGNSLGRVRAWLQGLQLGSLAELRPEDLAGLRDTLERSRKRVAKAGGRQGERRKVTEPRAASSINSDLRASRIFFQQMRRLGRTPEIDRDAIAENLRDLRGEKSLPRPLRPNEIKALLNAALAHDRETFAMTRADKADGRTGETPRYAPIAPFVLTVLLGGFRLSEARSLRWADCQLDSTAPEIIVRAAATKTRHERAVDLAITPALVELFKALRLRRSGAFIFSGGDRPLSLDEVRAAHARLAARGAPEGWTWQRLRQSAASYATNAPGIYGGASAFMAAKRHGHSVAIAEARYAGLLRDIPRSARTLEAAMRCEKLAREIVRDAEARARRIVSIDALDAESATG